MGVDVSMSTFLPSLRSIPLALAALGLLLLGGARPAEASSCPAETTVVQWTPAKGPVARFITATFFASSTTGIWIGLGRTDTAFWSAEGGSPNDACDDCDELFLVETKLTGTRRRHKVVGDADWARIGSDLPARRAYVLARLWSLAKKTWPSDKLKQGYTLAIGKPPASDPSGPPPYAAEVLDAPDLRLRYRFTSSTHMCWCIYDWQAQRRVGAAATIAPFRP
jgi:hypothetical protein